MTRCRGRIDVLCGMDSEILQAFYMQLASGGVTGDLATLCFQWHSNIELCSSIMCGWLAGPKREARQSEGKALATCRYETIEQSNQRPAPWGSGGN